MDKYVMLMDAECETCHHKMYLEQREKTTPEGKILSKTLTLKCTNEECKEFNKPYVIPRLKLVPYV